MAGQCPVWESEPGAGNYQPLTPHLADQLDTFPSQLEQGQKQVSGFGIASIKQSALGVGASRDIVYPSIFRDKF